MLYSSHPLTTPALLWAPGSRSARFRPLRWRRAEQLAYLVRKNMETRKSPATPKSRRILVVDVGGTHVKVLATGHRTPIKIPSGPEMTAKQMVAAVRKATQGWLYDVVSIGYPGPVLHGKPLANPRNLGAGWMGFDFRKAFGHPVKILNDAAMQALGSYEGGKMLFLGLGTGLGTALIIDGILEPFEIAHLPYKRGLTYEDYVGLRGLKKLGKKRWRRRVADVTERLKGALEADYVVLGGGNVKLLKTLPPGARRGSNASAFRGGFRLWRAESPKGRLRVF
jgi:polyphosphate glucokinase